MKNLVFHSDVTERLKNKGRVLAAWAQMGSNLSAEIFAEAGFDMVVIDSEHSPTTLPGLAAMMQATKGTNCFPMVRVPWNDMVMLKQTLDVGAAGVHIPYVSTPEEAEAAVWFCKYPPMGVRGIAGSQRAVCYGQDKADYYARANKDIIVMIAIETPEGVANIEKIAAIPGLDGIFIGPADLSTSMGHLANPAHPEVQAAIRHIEEVVNASDKFLGTVSAGKEDTVAKFERGYNLLYAISDTTGLSNLAVKTVAEMKEYLR